MKSFLLLTLTVLSLSVVTKADGVMSGRETINLPLAINPGSRTGDCKTAAVITLDYDKLTVLVQETVAAGSCSTIDPNGKIFEIRQVSIRIDENKGVGVSIMGRTPNGSGLFYMLGNRKWLGPFSHGLPILMVDADMDSDRSPRWAILKDERSEKE